MEKPHKKLDVWRGAVNLAIDIFQITNDFLKEYRFALNDQVRRAALSIGSNIAEGAARQTKKEFANYLHIAQASVSELDTQLEVVKRLKLLNEGQWARLDEQMNHIDTLLSGLIRHLTFGKSPRTTPYLSPFTPSH